MFSVRTAGTGSAAILNICDADLLDRTVSDEKRKIHIGRGYYGGDLVDEREATRLLRAAASINMVGRNTISLSIHLGIGIESGVMYVGDVPFLLVFRG